MKNAMLVVLTVFFLIASTNYILGGSNSSASIIHPTAVFADPAATPSATPTMTASPSATPTPAPSVNITAPQNGAVVRKNSNVLAEASVSDTTFVQRVEFYINNTLTCSDLTTPYTCSWRTTAEKNKTYALVAKAVGAFGSVDSPVVSITAR